MTALATAALAEPGGAPPRDDAPRALAFDTPALRANSVARSFRQPPPKLRAPKVKVERADGVADLDFGPGLTLLSLWAPWCAPCLMELKDLAEIQRAYGGDSFRVLPVLTAPMSPISLREAKALLAKSGAGDLEAIIDGSPTKKALFETLTRREGGGSAGQRYGLPCNLVVDRGGVVLGRQFGAKITLPPGAIKPGQSPTKEMLASARTDWSAPEGRAFAVALQRGEIAGAVSSALVRQ